MSIKFIPNDPLVTSIPIRSVKPRPDRNPSQAGFHFFVSPAESEADLGTPEFLYWQCREALLLTLDVWEQLSGPLATWSNATAKLNVQLDGGNMPNAFYDNVGQSLCFYHSTFGRKTIFTGASTDVVSHECGHALLESIRPELSSPGTEFAAFHESFGDCMSLLVVSARPTPWFPNLPDSVFV